MLAEFVATLSFAGATLTAKTGMVGKAGIVMSRHNDGNAGVPHRSEPKRHHWWPQFHSSRWAAASDGCLHIVFRDGRVVRTTPVNAAVISRHNTVRDQHGRQRADLERFFADFIDAPASAAFDRLAATPVTIPKEFVFDLATLSRDRKEVRKEGFRIPRQMDVLRFGEAEKQAVARYVASMMVRVPTYKDELRGGHLVKAVAAAGGTPEIAQHLVDVNHIGLVRAHVDEYAAKIGAWQWIVLEADGTHEFLFGDAPVITREFNGGDMDVFFPLTPRRALLATQRWTSTTRGGIQLFKAANKAMGYYNRCVVLNAERVVFARAAPNLAFVRRHFGERQLRIRAEARAWTH